MSPLERVILWFVLLAYVVTDLAEEAWDGFWQACDYLERYPHE